MTQVTEVCGRGCDQGSDDEDGSNCGQRLELNVPEFHLV